MVNLFYAVVICACLLGALFAVIVDGDFAKASYLASLACFNLMVARL